MYNKVIEILNKAVVKKEHGLFGMRIGRGAEIRQRVL